MSTSIHADPERARAAARAVAPALADRLEAQNAALAPSPAREANLRALRSGAAAVVTGQQVGLFLGPLFTLYKAASAIRLARELSVRWNEPVVPVFWLQTEDHDLAEIATCGIARGRGEPLRLTLPADDARVSIAHRRLPEVVSDAVASLRDALSGQPHGEPHADRIARHYRPGAGWAEAFAGVLGELFAEEGLVVIDPRDPALAALAAPVHRRAILEAEAITEALVARERALESAGRPVPVHVRADSPLSFFHPDGAEGPRYRLEGRGARFVEIGRGGEHALDDLLRDLDGRAACFSTSALLRPILQDSWFPTVAYVGGPAEVAYFAQIEPLYRHFGLPMPAVVPRIRLRLLEEKTRRLLSRLRLSAEEACGPIEEVLLRAAGGSGRTRPGEAIVRPAVEAFQRALDAAVPELRGAGDRIDRAVAKTRASVERSAAKLARRHDRLLAERDREVAEAVRRLRDRLLPGGIPQERAVGIAGFAAMLGDRALVERVLAAARPFADTLEDLEL